MSDTSHRRSGGRAARQATRLAAHIESVPYLTRTLTPVEVLNEEGIELIEHNADTILEQVGVIFRDYPEALSILADGGADVDGDRVRFPRGMCRQIVTENAPVTYTQHARNPARSVEIGGNATVLAPNYGSPFVHDLDRGRRYATLADFENFVKLDLLLAVPAPLRRHGVRAGRRTGQQAAPRHGVRPPPVQRQAVHGLGHRREPRRRTASTWPASASAATSPTAR